MIERLKELFYNITGKDPLGANRFIGTLEAVSQREESEKCVFVLDNTTWAAYYDGKETENPPGTYYRWSRTSADIFYSAGFYRGYRFPIATFLLRKTTTIRLSGFGEAA